MLQKHTVAKKEETGDYQIKSVSVETPAKISIIDVKIDAAYIIGLRFMDQNGQAIVKINMRGDGEGEWASHEVPDGEEIIGLYISEDHNSKAQTAFQKERIQTLGFVTR